MYHHGKRIRRNKSMEKTEEVKAWRSAKRNS
jgi:hypothetical protein